MAGNVYLLCSTAPRKFTVILKLSSARDVMVTAVGVDDR